MPPHEWELKMGDETFTALTENSVVPSKSTFRFFDCTSLLNDKCLLCRSGSALSCAGLTFGQQSGGDGDGFARWVAGRSGLGAPRVAGDPHHYPRVLLRDRTEFPGFALTHTHGPARGSQQNLLCSILTFGWLGPIPEGFCCLGARRLCPDPFPGSSACPL